MKVISCPDGFADLGRYSGTSWYWIEFLGLDKNLVSGSYGAGMMIPLGPCYVDEIDSTIAFDQSDPILFDNLRNVHHEKYDGVVFAVDPQSKESMRDEYPIHISTGSSEQYYLCHFGLDRHLYKGPIYKYIMDENSLFRHYFTIQQIYKHEWRDDVLIWTAFGYDIEHKDATFNNPLRPYFYTSIFICPSLGRIGRGYSAQVKSRRLKYASYQAWLNSHNSLESELDLAFDLAYAEYKKGILVHDFGYIQRTMKGVPDVHLRNLPRMNIPRQLTQVSWSKLASEAYQDIGVWENNGLAYFADLKELSNLAKSSISSLKGIAKSNRKIAAASSLYLSIHYGWKLMLSDTKDLIESLIDYNKSLKYASRVQSSECYQWRDWTVENRLQCYYELFGQLTNNFSILVNLLDLDLSLSKLWDMTSYSFVVDWFIGIGDVLSAWDKYEDLMNTHDLIGYGRSQKIIRRFSADLLGNACLLGTVTYSYYDRNYSTYPILPTVIPDSQLPVDNLTHYVEGSALIASRR